MPNNQLLPNEQEVERVAREEWSLCFYGSPPSVMVLAGVPGLPDSRRDVAFMEFANKEERATKGKALQAMVSEHNLVISAMQDSGAIGELRDQLERMTLCVEQGDFYGNIGEHAAKSRALLSKLEKGQ